MTTAWGVEIVTLRDAAGAPCPAKPALTYARAARAERIESTGKAKLREERRRTGSILAATAEKRETCLLPRARRMFTLGDIAAENAS